MVCRVIYHLCQRVILFDILCLGGILQRCALAQRLLRLRLQALDLLGRGLVDGAVQ